MDLSNVVSLWKPALRGLIVVLALTLASTVLVNVVTELYDLRMIVAVCAGAVGYERLYDLFARFNILQ